MKLLAFDSSTEVLSIALSLDGNVTSYSGEGGPKASAVILPQIQLILTSANIQLTDLDGIAFGAGPGAFTGVRVACGVAQGLGYGANIPVVGINTLLAVAQASGYHKVIVCLDARMGEIYHAAFINENGQWHEQSATQVCKPQAAPEILVTHNEANLNTFLKTGDATHAGDWVGVGNAWAIYSDALHAIYANHLTNINTHITPSAEAILQLATPIFAAGLGKPASEAMPIYIRNHVALTTLEREAGHRL